jgi:hypothetical protein
MKKGFWKMICFCIAPVLVAAGCAGTPAASPAPNSDGPIKIIDAKANFGKELASMVYWDEGVADTVNWTTGHRGEGIDFDGYPSTQVRLNTKPLVSAKALTLQAWIYWRGAGLKDTSTYNKSEGGQLIFGMSGIAGHYKVVVRDDEYGGGVTFIGGWYDRDVYCISDIDMPKNQWTMITATLDGENMTLYFNGEMIGQEKQAVVPVDLGIDLFRLGSSFWAPPSLNAILDDVSIYRKALSPEEVKQLYEETK